MRYRYLVWRPFFVLILLLMANLAGHAFQRSSDAILSPLPGLQVRKIPEEQANVLESRYPGWYGTWNSASGTIHRALGPSLSLGSRSINKENVEEIARRFVQENHEIFRVSGEDLKLVRAVRRCGKWFVVFARYFRGVKVWDSRVDLRFTDDGKVFLIGADTYPSLDININPGLTLESAVQSLLYSGAQLKNSELVVFPEGGESGPDFSLAWYVEVWTERPLAHYIGIIDANTGEPLLLYDDIRYDTIIGDIVGLIHPQHRSDPYVQMPFEYEWVGVFGSGGGWGISDTLGHFEIEVEGPGKRLVKTELVGNFVRVTNYAGPEGVCQDSLTPGVSDEMAWDDTNSLASERDGYFHTNVAHDHIKLVDPGFVLLDYQMPCEMNIPNYSNAYWDGYGMHFGAGGNDFGQHADVVYHEYGHGIVDYQYRPSAPSGAMHEGFADFYAATITNDSRIGEGVMTPRDLDNNMRSPEDLRGESHHDGMIIGGALWHMRENLGDVPLAESLFHFARYGLPGSPSQPDPQNFLDYLVEVYVVDDDDGDLTNGTPHGSEIALAFGRHGIGPTLDMDRYEVTDISAQADMFLDAGDTVKMVNWLRFSQAIGIGADSIVATMSCTEPSIDIIKETCTFGEIPIDSTGDNSADPFLFVVSDTLTRVIDVSFFVQLFANPIFYDTYFTVVVRVGHPEILLVDDDQGAPFEVFFESSLDSLGIKPYDWDVKSLSAPDVAVLSKFPAVIWFTGDADSATLTDEEALSLSQYLDSGGGLFLTGQNIGEDIGAHWFYSDYLKASFVGPRSLDHILEGAPGDLIGDGLTVVTAGSGGGGNQTSQDVIDALPGADTVFLYDDGVAGVRYDSGVFKTVYFSFGLEGVNDFAKGFDHRPIILKRILLWFGATVDCDEECGVQASRSLHPKLFQNSPNPFSSATGISVIFPEKGVSKNRRLEVYDVSGRMVKSFDISEKGSGKVKLVWDGRDEAGGTVSSGIYFCRLTTDNFVSSVKMVKLK